MLFYNFLKKYHLDIKTMTITLMIIMTKVKYVLVWNKYLKVSELFDHLCLSYDRIENICFIMIFDLIYETNKCHNIYIFVLITYLLL